MNDSDFFLIGDVPGFTPQIGRWIERSRYTVMMIPPKEFGQPEIPSQNIVEVLYRIITYY